MTPFEFRLLNEFQRVFPLVAQPFAVLADALGTRRGGGDRVARAPARRRCARPHRRGVPPGCARRLDARRDGSARRAPRSGRRGRVGLPRREPQLRARAPRSTSGSWRRRRTTPRSTRCSRASPGSPGSRCSSCRSSRSTTSTSVSPWIARLARHPIGALPPHPLPPLPKSGRGERRRTARARDGGTPARRAGCDRASPRRRARGRPRARAAPLRRARRARGAGRAGGDRPACALAGRRPDPPVRRRCPPPRAWLARERDGGVGRAGRGGRAGSAAGSPARRASRSRTAARAALPAGRTTSTAWSTGPSGARSRRASRRSSAALGLDAFPHAVLFSRTRFKQTGPRFSSAPEAIHG